MNLNSFISVKKYKKILIENEVHKVLKSINGFFKTLVKIKFYFVVEVSILRRKIVFKLWSVLRKQEIF